MKIALGKSHFLERAQGLILDRLLAALLPVLRFQACLGKTRQRGRPLIRQVQFLLVAEDGRRLRSCSILKALRGADAET